MFAFDQSRSGVTFPRSLNDAVSQTHNEVWTYLTLSAARRAQTDPPLIWKIPFERDVIASLKASFQDRCAFCEQALVRNERLQPYRFRPPGFARDARGPVHPESYLWTAFNWQNLFPICEGCRPNDPSRFPVSGTRWSPKSNRLSLYLESAAQPIQTREAALLLHPGEWRDDLALDAFSLDGTAPLIYRRPRKASDMRKALARLDETISFFHLNRPSLVEARCKAFAGILHLLRRGGDVFFDRSRWRTFETGPFVSALRAMLHVALNVENPYGGRRILPLDRQLLGLQKRLLERGTLSDLADRIEADYQTGTRTPSPPDAAAEPVANTFEPMPPRLTGVSIRNYKSLENIELSLKRDLSEADRLKLTPPGHTIVPDAPCLLILGENATGKSSILEAIVLACLPPEDRAALGLEPERMTLRPDYLGKRNGAPRATAQVTLSFADDSTHSLTIKHKTGALSGAMKERYPLVFGFGAHRYYGTAGARSGVSRVETLFHPNRAIANPEDWLTHILETRPDEINDIITALRYLIEIDDDFENIAPRLDAKTGKTRWMINFKRGAGGHVTSQRFDTVSSGYRAVLALVCEVLAGLFEAFPSTMRDARHASAIVAVDEIEAHLHPRWKLTIIDRLRRALPNVTFIFTSHDPLCVRGTVQGEVVVLNRYVTGAKRSETMLPEKVECVDIVEQSDHLTVEQMLQSDLFQLLTTEAEGTRAGFARVADVLAAEAQGRALTEPDRALLARFRGEIKDALPYGDTVIPQLVQKALAEYVAETRGRSAAEHEALRRRAIDSLKDFLKGESP